MAHTPRIRTLLPTVLAIAAAVLVTGPALATGTYAAGSAVTRSDFDFTPGPKAATVSLCFVDDEGDGEAQPGDLLYILVGAACGDVKGEDIRLFGPEGLASGALVKNSADADFGMPTEGPLDHAIRYFEAKGDDKYKAGDTMYIDLQNIGEATVDPGDFRLSAFGESPGNTWVRDGDADVATSLLELKGAPTTLTDPDIVYKAGKTYYVNVDKGVIGDADVVVEEHDVRLTGNAPDPFDPAATPDIKVTAVRLEPATVAAGEAFRVLIDVVNKGTATGAGLVETILAGTVVDARGTPSLSKDGKATLVVGLVAPAAPGPATVSAGGVSAELGVEAAGEGTSAQVEALLARLALLESTLDANQRGDLAEQAVLSQVDERLGGLETAVDLPGDEAVSVTAAESAGPGDGSAVPGPALPLVLVGVLGAVVVARARRAR